MGAYTLPVNEISPYAPQVYGQDPWSQYLPYANTDPNASMEDIYARNRSILSSGANNLNTVAGAQLNYYGTLQPRFQQAADTALNQLQETPGYTSQEAAAISGNPYQPVQTLVNNQEQGTGAMLNQYQAILGGQLGKYEGALGGATSAYGTGVRGAAQGLSSGLASAQEKFAPLDTAVNDPSLGFDPNQTERQLSDQDVQDLQTQAMTSVGNQFRTAQDTLEHQAAAEGATSPAQLAALRQALITQQGATAGDAATNARIAALQAQYQRAAGIEQQREGAVQTQAGLRATAATTEEAAAQAAAAQAGMAHIGAEQSIGQAGLTSAQNLGQAALAATGQYGQFSTTTADQMAKEQLAAQQQAEQQQSQRAQDVAQTRIGGQTQYRQGVAQQQGMAQQGGQAAVQTQLGTYQAATGGLNSAASGQGNFEVGKPSLGDTAGAALTKLFDAGGVATEPTNATIAEHGPEMVVPLKPKSDDWNAVQLEQIRKSRYRPAERMAA